MMQTWTSVAGAILLCLPFPANADVAPPAGEEADEIVVVGRKVSTSSSQIVVEKELLVDTAAALKDIPGANVNRNGPITGIPQYRGMYGDRIAVDLDDLGVMPGCPNAMDTPLSYMSPMITEELVVARGIASVSLAPESIGGHIGTTLSRGEFSKDGARLSGLLGTRYSGNGNLSTSAARLTLSNERHRVSLVAEADSGEDIDTPKGRIVPTGLHRDRYDVSYGYADDRRQLLLFAGKLDTEDTGTPALPMDIIDIDTRLYGAEFGLDVSDTVALEARLAYNDVSHLMDNYSLREAPMAPMQRHNTTEDTGSQFSLTGIVDLPGSQLRVGLDGIAAEYDSIIRNPNNATFAVRNFTDINHDLRGLFGEWVREADSATIEVGLRLNRVEAKAGPVGATGMMGMMADQVAQLADDFNVADRSSSWDTVDAVVKYRRSFSPVAEWSVELGSKSRAPSYQELYLWLPLQATGGLADGRSYIGNLELRAERSRELVVGLAFDNGRFGFSPQAFYRDVADYIQGVPSSNPVANSVAMMMSGVPPLQFDNVAARIWGIDAAWRFELSPRLLLDGTITITRGRRADTDDNLYRQVPYNGSVGLSFQEETWSLRSELVGYMDQDAVSVYNAEQATSGYWLANLSFAWTPLGSLRIEARIDNLFDESYQDHVAGINRAGGSDLPTGVRLYGAGRTVTAGVIYSF
jgi:iron complex outermembrane receptor protein